jgi:hypothetical protein
VGLGLGLGGEREREGEQAGGEREVHDRKVRR